MNVEDPCRKGLSFMKAQNVLTISTNSESAFAEVVKSWFTDAVNGQALETNLLSTGYTEGEWWAIATTNEKIIENAAYFGLLKEPQFFYKRPMSFERYLEEKKGKEE